MALISTRIPHVVTRKDLAVLLTPTYAAAQRVDEEEAHERMSRAVDDPVLVELLYGAISAGLEARKGRRTALDELIDRLSEGVETRLGRVRAAPETPGLAAVLVRIDLTLGLAAQTLWNLLESEKGRTALDAGLRELGAHLVKELLRSRGTQSRE
jgi:hypothetical protein